MTEFTCDKAMALMGEYGAASFKLGQTLAQARGSSDMEFKAREKAGRAIREFVSGALGRVPHLEAEIADLKTGRDYFGAESRRNAEAAQTLHARNTERDARIAELDRLNGDLHDQIRDRDATIFKLRQEIETRAGMMASQRQQIRKLSQSLEDATKPDVRQDKLREALDREEKGLFEAVENQDDEEGPGIMPSDVSAAFYRIREALARVRAKAQVPEELRKANEAAYQGTWSFEDDGPERGTLTFYAGRVDQLGVAPWGPIYGHGLNIFGRVPERDEHAQAAAALACAAVNWLRTLLAQSAQAGDVGTPEPSQETDALTLAYQTIESLRAQINQLLWKRSQDTAPPEPEPFPHIAAQGRAAWLSGRQFHDNPYGLGSKYHDAWERGWQQVDYQSGIEGEGA